MGAYATAKPRVAFVVQRAGTEVIGGAESLCLQVAQRMSKYWETEILTTCALDYMTWNNHYSEGMSTVGDALIRRFIVDRPRDVAAFNALSGELLRKGPAATLVEQEHWMRAQGPMSTSLFEYIERHADEYEAFIFFGYLYATTYFGLPLVKGKAYLAPLAHDEWTIHFAMWDGFFALPDGFIFQTESERSFLQRRFPSIARGGAVAGIGITKPENVSPSRFRERYRLSEPFLLYVGRIDESKGCAELIDFFIQVDLPYYLVLIGTEVMPVPFHDRIIYLGIVSDVEKSDALAACDWLVLPSHYESLSMVLLEAWAAGRPAVVNGRCDVLKQHCEKAGAGLWYESHPELQTILTSISDSEKEHMGSRGIRYVTQEYSWDRVEQVYLATVAPVPLRSADAQNQDIRNVR